MITLPSGVIPNSATPTFVDFGGVQSSPMGGASQRVNRAGARYRVSFTLPVQTPAIARVIVSRLIQAKQDKLRVAMPLNGVSQGTVGTPLVNGAVSAAASSIPVKGLTASYAMKEGYWMTIVDSSGNRFLHCVTADGTADGTGNLTVSITPNLRKAFADGDTIILDAPTIEGWVIGDEWQWQLSVEQLTPFEFTIEEVR